MSNLYQISNPKEKPSLSSPHLMLSSIVRKNTDPDAENDRSMISDVTLEHALMPKRSILSDDDGYLTKDKFVAFDDDDDDGNDGDPDALTLIESIESKEEITTVPLAAAQPKVEEEVGPLSPSTMKSMSADESNDHNSYDAKMPGSNRKIYCLGAGLLLCLIVIVVVASLLVGGKDRGAANSSNVQEAFSQPSLRPSLSPPVQNTFILPTASPTGGSTADPMENLPSITVAPAPVDTTLPTSMSPVAPVSVSVKDMLTSVAFDGGIALRDSGSPQNKALDWLVTQNTNIQDLGSVVVIQTFVLATIYFATRGNRWIRQDNWLTPDVSVCFWYTTGDTADVCTPNSDGTMILTQLNLTENNVQGTFPTELAHLSTLQSIVFSNNAITGTLPDQLFTKILELKDLVLYGNEIQGTLPTSIGLLTDLSHLDFHSNVFEGTLPTEIALMSSLQTLVLSSNRLNGTIPSQFGALTNLKSLYLFDNDLSGSVPAELCALSLTALQVGCKSKVVCSCCTDQCDTGVPQNSTVNSTDSAEDQSSNTELLNLLSPLYSDGGTVLRNQSSAQYAAMEWLSSSELLSVYSNQQKVQRYAMAALFFSLNGDLWFDSSDWLTELDECFWVNSAVVSCDGNGTLVGLSLTGQNLTGSIPPELGLLSRLEVLELQDNQISGSIPPEVYDLRNLLHLDLSMNNLTGSLSKNLGQLTNLRDYFAVYKNSLRGPIPTEIGQLTKLEVVDMGTNQISGTVPSTVGQMTSLLGFSIHDTRISGSLPTELALLTALEVLYIDASGITGPFPEAICNLASIEEFYSDCEEIGCTCCTTCCVDNMECA
jgi:Leucine-rich repeat (LRR) protein